MANSSSSSSVTRSPFFKPSTPHVITTTTQTTPGGTRHKVSRRTNVREIEEHKSTRLGCTANLINAIIGSGIVGIPYAILQAGFVTGTLLVILCALLTDKSLRLLIATAKHAQVPSYETLAEAAFGRWGFGFISINMFIMAYGAMLSYLMIVKDTFSVAFGVDPDNLQIKRAMLFIISVLIIVPLSSQRDMADLAFTSRISVVIDTLLVLVVAYKSPVSVDRIESLFVEKVVNGDSDLAHDDFSFWIHTHTVFVGLGVLSFAFVCQHSAFIIAGSLENPTIQRWSQVTNVALSLCASLALICGISGYMGFLENTQGNILNNLQLDDTLSNVARSMLGTTMLFVYPMESFVARHVCVVLLFEGRRAHEGEDASVLSRRDRRIGLTVALYISALVPALLFEDLGKVLAATGTVGGSCLSYVGPGAVYLGIHGDQFIDLIKKGTWWRRFVKLDHTGSDANIRRPHAPGTGPSSSSSATASTATPSSETTALLQVDKGGPLNNDSADDNDDDVSIFIKALQAFTWYILFMPLWCWIARFGERALVKHQEETALKSPHPMRIGNVVPDTPPIKKKIRRQMQEQQQEEGKLNRVDDALSSSLRNDLVKSGSFKGGINKLSSAESSSLRPYNTGTKSSNNNASEETSLNQRIGAKLLADKHQQQLDAAEVDPQKSPPTFWDFLIAIFFFLFGLVALVAGMVSIGLQS